MRPINQILLASLFLFVPFASNSQVWEWGRMGKSVNGNGAGYIVVTDPASNVYVGGNYFGGSVAFGADTIYNNVPPTLNGAAFVAKYDAAGSLIWARSLGIGNITGELTSIALDAYGYIYIAGYFGSTSFILGSDTLFKSAASSTAMYIAKLNDLGDVLWTSTPITADTGSTSVSSIGVDGDGNIYTDGNFTNWSIFGTDTLRDNTHSFVAYHFIAKYDEFGNPLWAKQSATGNVLGGGNIAVDRDGNAYIAGQYNGSGIVFGSDSLAAYPDNSSFLVKYNTDGDQIWAKRSRAGVDALTVSKAGDAVIIAGVFFDTLITGGDTIVVPIDTSMTHFSGFTAQFDAFGSEIWTKIITGSYPHTNSVCTDDSSNVYVTGDFGITPGDMVGISGISVACTADGGGVFVAKYTGAGNAKWATQASGGGVLPLSISCDAPGANIFVTGFFSNTAIAFGYDTLDCSGELHDQLFVSKLNGNQLSVPETNLPPNSLYPNPAHDQLTVTGTKQIRNILINDYVGHIVYNNTYNEPTVNIPVGSLAAGLYLVTITDSDGTKTVKKVVKE